MNILNMDESDDDSLSDNDDLMSDNALRADVLRGENLELELGDELEDRVAQDIKDSEVEDNDE
jgi:hypothetical protein